jgi:TPR repeat protein
MWEFNSLCLEESFALFERAAAKGHEESIWIGSVVKEWETEVHGYFISKYGHMVGTVEMEYNKNTLTEAFTKAGEPLGWYFAVHLSEDDREQFNLIKKNAEGGCSWSQAEYGYYFMLGDAFVQKDEKAHVEWLEKAANQNNPRAMDWLGEWFRYEGGDEEKAFSYFFAGAELGWKRSMLMLAEMLYDGEGCARDLRQAAIWGAKGSDPNLDSDAFWSLLGDAKEALESGATEDLDCDFNQLCYLLGWGLFWYQHGSEEWDEHSDEDQVFANRCLGFYCSCVELQQKSIFTFLLCWNRTTGVKGPGQIIGKMIWERREENLVREFEEPRRRSARLKQIKK